MSENDRAANPTATEARRAWERAYYAKNIEKMREKQRRWRRSQGPQKMRERERRYRTKHRAKHLERRRKQQRRKSMAICAAAGREYHPRTKGNPVVRKLRPLGISIRRKEMDEAVSTQGGVCAICGHPPVGRGGGGSLCFDHDHATGRLRGLLCGFCNIGLGGFQDSVGSLQAAIEYLLKYGNPEKAQGVGDSRNAVEGCRASAQRDAAIPVT